MWIYTFNFPGDYEYYIDGKLDSNGDWRFSNGDLIQDFYWASEFPNINPDYKCLHVMPFQANKWRNFICWQFGWRGVVCEMANI